MKVLIPTKLDDVAADLLRARGLTVIQDADHPLSELVAAHPDAKALIVRSEKIDAAVLDSLPELRAVVRAGAGYDTIDTKHARRNDVAVMNTPGANANAVAEEVVCLALAAYRHVIRGDRSVREGRWEKKDLMGRELLGKTVGIIGLGNIGQLLAKRLAGFEPILIAYDPLLSAGRAEKLGVELCPDLNDIFRRADIISLHVPETDETRGLVNGERLALAKPGTMIINCSRAGVINEADLRAAKREKTLYFCNDVYSRDEPGEKSVADIADVMLPHLGANTHEANCEAARRAAEQLLDYLERGVSTYVVNKGVPDGLSPEYMRLAYYLGKIARGYLGARPPRRIETSYYGDLKQYATWFLGPIVAGVSADFDPLLDFRDAANYLEEMGIAYEERDVDEQKGYGESMTLDLVEGSGTTFNRVSVRGTVAESVPMVSRLDDFDRLYFDPRGRSVMVTYADRPGVLTRITGVIAKYDINIDDMRAPHDAKSGDSLAVLKVNKPVPQEALDAIAAEVNAKRAVYIGID